MKPHTCLFRSNKRRLDVCRNVTAWLKRCEKTGTCDATFGSGNGEAPTVNCIFGFGPALDHLIMHAKVVLVSHYFRTAALEVHRIDRLLSMGKVVVAVASTDAILDDFYEKGIVFVDSEKDLPQTVEKLLADPDLYNTVETSSRIWWRARRRSALHGFGIEPLCTAIHRLGSNMAMDKHSRPFVAPERPQRDNTVSVEKEKKKTVPISKFVKPNVELGVARRYGSEFFGPSAAVGTAP